MGIVLNEEWLATTVVSATWSPTASEVSGPDWADIDAETGTEIGGAILGASARSTSVANEWSTPTNGTLEDMMLSQHLTEIEWPHLVPPTKGSLVVVNVSKLVCEVDLYSCVKFTDGSVLPITNKLVTIVHTELKYIPCICLCDIVIRTWIQVRRRRNRRTQQTRYFSERSSNFVFGTTPFRWTFIRHDGGIVKSCPKRALRGCTVCSSHGALWRTRSWNVDTPRLCSKSHISRSSKCRMLQVQLNPFFIEEK